jgi:microcystin-dependent protein
MYQLSLHKRRSLIAPMVVFAIGLAGSARADPYTGEILWLANEFCPTKTLPADGALLPISEHPPLFSLLGITYGGDGVTTFAVPDLRGRVPMGVAEAANPPRSLGQSGHTVRGRHPPTAKEQRTRIATLPYLVLRPCIVVSGVFPSRP